MKPFVIFAVLSVLCPQTVSALGTFKHSLKAPHIRTRLYQAGPGRASDDNQSVVNTLNLQARPGRATEDDQTAVNAFRLQVLKKIAAGESPRNASNESTTAANETSKKEKESGPPPEGGIPVQDKKKHEYTKIWSGESSFDVKTEGMIAFVWILMVVSMPLMIVKVEGEHITKTQVTLFVIMWIVFVGGIYVFTQVVKFQSIHFTTLRPLTIVECIYLMAQVLTTVGYGDITPADSQGQVFMAAYVLFTILVTANLVSEVSMMVLAHSQKYADSLGKIALEYKTVFVEKVAKDQGKSKTLDDEEEGGDTEESEEMEMDTNRNGKESVSSSASVLSHAEKRKSRARSSNGDGVTLFNRHTSPRTRKTIQVTSQWFSKAAPPLPWNNLIGSFATYAGFAALGTCFFHYYPDENKTWLQGVYMSIITLSTVGFGAVTPNTEGGMVFASFWMLFGSAALVSVVGCFTELCVKLKTREHWEHEVVDHFNDALDMMPERMTEAEFLRFGMKFAKLAGDAECDAIVSIFNEISQDGLVDKELVRTLMSGAVEKKQKEKEEHEEAAKDVSVSGSVIG